MKHRLTLAAVLLLATACSSGDGAPPADGEAGAGTSVAAAAGGGDDLADITSYELSMDKIDRFYAAQRNMMLVMKDMSPEERQALEMENDNPSLDEMAQAYERHPALNKAMRDAGLSPKEFATLTMAMVQSAMASMALQMRPNDNQDSLVREMKANMANIKFMQEHEQELQQKQAAFQAEMQRLGINPQGDDQGDGEGDDQE